MLSWRRSDGFQRAVLLALASSTALVAVGAAVRALGAGMGCPDWPRCFGRWIPPWRADQIDPAVFAQLAARGLRFEAVETWIEYGNRLFGMLTGLLVLLAAVQAVRLHRVRPGVPLFAGLALVSVAFQGWLGGQVVAASLAPAVVTAHLFLALVLVLLLSAAFLLSLPRPSAAWPARRRLAVSTAGVGVFALVLAQMTLGAEIRGEIESMAAALVPRAERLAALGAAWDWHRALALPVLVAVLAFAFLARRDAPLALRRLLEAAGLFGVLQLLVGAGLSATDLAPALQVLHVLFGLLLAAVCALGAWLAWRA